MRSICLAIVVGLVSPVVAKPDPVVTRVVALLQEMQNQVNKEAKADQATYANYSKWCTDNDKEKTQAIESAKKRIEEIRTALNGAGAKIAGLNVEISSLKKEIKQNEEALVTAENVREKEAVAFTKELGDLQGTESSLNTAIKLLSRKSFLQAGEADDLQATLIQAQAVVQHMSFLQTKQTGAGQADIVDLITSLKMQPSLRSHRLSALELDALPGEPPKKAKAKTGPTQQLLGLIKAMSDDFAKKVSETKKREEEAVASFAKVKAAKLTEIKAGTDLLGRKKAELAEITLLKANGKDDMEALAKAHQADTTFLENMRKECQTESKDYTERTKSRNDELKALAEAQKALQSFGTSFLQMKDALSMDQFQEEAFYRLASVAQTHHNWALLATAVEVRLGALSKVVKVLKKSLTTLKQQQAEEVRRKASCESDITSAEKGQKQSAGTQKKLVTKFNTTTLDIQGTKSTLAKLEADLKASDAALHKADIEREQQHKAFHAALVDCKATIKVLKTAIEKLKGFYSLIQVKAHNEATTTTTTKPAPPKGKKYEKQGGGATGVIGLLEKIIEDAEKSEKKLVMSEEKAQANYVKLREDAKKSMSATRQAIQERQDDLVKRRASRNEVKVSQRINDADVVSMSNLVIAHHKSCDDLLQNFKSRQQARKEEIGAVLDAIHTLSGAK